MMYFLPAQEICSTIASDVGGAATNIVGGKDFPRCDSALNISGKKMCQHLMLQLFMAAVNIVTKAFASGGKFS